MCDFRLLLTAARSITQFALDSFRCSSPFSALLGPSRVFIQYFWPEALFRYLTFAGASIVHAKNEEKSALRRPDGVRTRTTAIAGSQFFGHSSASNSTERRSRFAGNKVIARVLISARSPILRPIDKRFGAAVIKISQRQNTFRRRKTDRRRAHVQQRGPN